MSGQQHVLAALYPQERHSIHYTGGWVGPRASLDGWKILSTLGFDPGLSSPYRNEYQECFLGGKGARCIQLITLPPSCADCLEILEPQPPETSGPVQACNGIAFSSTN